MWIWNIRFQQQHQHSAQPPRNQRQLGERLAGHGQGPAHSVNTRPRRRNADTTRTEIECRAAPRCRKSVTGPESIRGGRNAVTTYTGMDHKMYGLPIPVHTTTVNVISIHSIIKK